MSACCPYCEGAGVIPEVEVVLADGPCEGHYLCALPPELPETLTAVVQADGESAVLDLPDARVEDNETPHEYILVGPVHMHGKKICRSYVAYESRLGRVAGDARVKEVEHDIAVRQGRAHPKRGATIHHLPTGGNAA